MSKSDQFYIFVGKELAALALRLKSNRVILWKDGFPSLWKPRIGCTSVNLM